MTGPRRPEPDPGERMRAEPERVAHLTPPERHALLDRLYAARATKENLRDDAERQAGQIQEFVTGLIDLLPLAPSAVHHDATVDMIMAAERLRHVALEFVQHGGRDRSDAVKAASHDYDAEHARWRERLAEADRERPEASDGQTS